MERSKEYGKRQGKGMKAGEGGGGGRKEAEGGPAYTKGIVRTVESNIWVMAF